MIIVALSCSRLAPAKTSHLDSYCAPCWWKQHDCPAKQVIGSPSGAPQRVSTIQKSEKFGSILVDVGSNHRLTRASYEVIFVITTGGKQLVVNQELKEKMHGYIATTIEPKASDLNC